jgi:hypothetical protein
MLVQPVRVSVCPSVASIRYGAGSGDRPDLEKSANAALNSLMCFFHAFENAQEADLWHSSSFLRVGI